MGSSPNAEARDRAAAPRFKNCSSLIFIFWVLRLDPAGLFVLGCAR
jgi:hypothetical protein